MPNKYLLLKKKSKFAKEVLPSKYEIFHKGVATAINADESTLDRYTIPNGESPEPNPTTTTTSTTTTTTTEGPTTTSTTSTTTTGGLTTSTTSTTTTAAPTTTTTSTTSTTTVAPSTTTTSTTTAAPPQPICVSGAGTSETNGTYTYSTQENGKNRYDKGPYYIWWYPPTLSWIISGPTNYYYSTDNVATPDLVTNWYLSNGIAPLPTVTAGVCPTTTTSTTSTTTTAAPTTTTSTTTTTTTALNTFNVTSDGSSAYIINGSSNPTLSITEGQTYIFNINASGHPFYIKTVNSTGTGNQYNDGVTNNGTDNGTITFIVPYNAPSTLYYNCQFHASMAGTINVIDVPTTTTSTTTTTTTQLVDFIVTEANDQLVTENDNNIIT